AQILSLLDKSRYRTNQFIRSPDHGPTGAPKFREAGIGVRKVPMRRPEYSGLQPPIGERGALLPERGPGASGLGLLFIWLDADRRTAGCRARLTEIVGPVNAASSPGRCNTIQYIDSTVLARQNHHVCLYPVNTQPAQRSGWSNLSKRFWLLFSMPSGF
ncbi:MAG TPA: hypothetical protein VNO32_60895, partial [Candidatus Acidoferrum sp.]|nr:hypothetical protein [Candidatus Acidoferrum sp.]